MYFELFFFCSFYLYVLTCFGTGRMFPKQSSFSKQNSLKERKAEHKNLSVTARTYAAVWAGIPVFVLLFFRRTFTVTQLLWMCTAVCFAFAIWLCAKRMRLVLPLAAGTYAGFCLKISVAMGVFYFAVQPYTYGDSIPEEGSGDWCREEVLFCFVLLSVLLVFSGKIRAVLERFFGGGFFAAFCCAVPVWGFYMIERVRNGSLDELGFLYVLGNSLLLALLFGCLFFALPYKKLAAGLFLTVCLVFGLANYYVSLFKGNPVMPSDLLSLNTAFQVAGGYSFQITEPVITGAMHWYASVGILCCIPMPRVNKGWKVRAAAGSLAAVVCAGGIFSLDFERIYGLDAVDQWSVNTFYNTKGSVLGFAELVKKLKLKEPDGYSVKRAEELLENGRDKTDTQPQREPVLIAIMDESFSDLRSLGEFECSHEYLKEWYAVDDFACKGTLYVSTYGGNTANSEFEFLTGNSIANCASGTVPYQIYDLKNVGNLAGILKADGYQAFAVHPQYKGNWNRMRTYANFGFDDFLGIEDFEDPRYVRSFVSDQSSFDKVIELYEQDHGKQFIFNVTMQNHGGYSMEEMAGTACVRLKKEWEKYEDVKTYLTLIKESDQALRELLDYFRNVEEPVIICIFGDHHPAVDAQWIQEVMGKSQEELSLEDVQSKYAVPYMIWANFDTPYLQREMDTSANYLGALFLENAGIRQSAYTDFLMRMQEEIPVLNAFGYQTKDGIWHSIDEEDAGGWIRDYRIVQYYAMFEKARLQTYFE